MARKTWTEEQKQAARDRMARAREAAAAKRAEREHAGPIQEPAAPLPSADEPQTEMPSDDPLELTAADLDLIRRRAREKIEAELTARLAEQKKAKIAAALDDEIATQRRLAGLTDASDDIIEFLVNVAPYSPGLVWDGKVYPHGTWLKKPRKVYDSMRDAMARSWESEDRAGNPNKKFAAERQMMGTQNPLMMERRMPDGTFTVGFYEPRVNGVTGAATGLRNAL